MFFDGILPREIQRIIWKMHEEAFLDLEEKNEEAEIYEAEVEYYDEEIYQKNVDITNLEQELADLEISKDESRRKLLRLYFNLHYMRKEYRKLKVK